jgi:hypothetical protein
MTYKKLLVLVAMLAMVGLLLTACQPEEVVKEVVVTQVVTQEVEREVVVHTRSRKRSGRHG